MGHSLLSGVMPSHTLTPRTAERETTRTAAPTYAAPRTPGGGSKHAEQLGRLLSYPGWLAKRRGAPSAPANAA
jgi:hypothetical protein